MLDRPTSAALVMNAGEFFGALKRVKSAISKEETRYYLCGVFVHSIEPGAIRFVATDGHRMMVSVVKTENEFTALTPVIIPAESVLDMLKTDAAKNRNAFRNVELEIEAFRIHLRDYAGASLVDCKPIDGTFPDYQRVIPQGNDKIVTLPRKEFMAACAAVTDFVTAASEGADSAICLAFAGNKLTIKGRSVLGNASCTLEFEAALPAPIEIAFKGQYIADILKAFPDSSNVTMSMADPGSAAIFKADETSTDFAVLMPRRW